jgi:hypothetical protein
MDSDGDQHLIVFRCEPFFEVKVIARLKIREYFRRKLCELVSFIPAVANNDARH